MLLKEADAFAVLNPLPLIPSLADVQLTPEPRVRLEKLIPAGGVLHVAVATAGQVIDPSPPSVTVVCAYAPRLIRARHADTIVRVACRSAVGQTILLDLVIYVWWQK